MILAIIIVAVMLWYSFRALDSTKLDREVGDRQKIEIRSTITPAVHEKSVTKSVISYFDLVNEKSTVKAYKKLVSEYESGSINGKEFQERMEPLIEKIDINEIALKGEERQGD